MARPSALNFVRLVLSAVCLLAAMPVVIPAVTDELWKITIIVTEFGHLLFFIPLLIFLPGWRGSKTGRLSALIAVTAMILFVSPLIRAIPLAYHLPEGLINAYQATGFNPDTQNTPMPRPLQVSLLASLGTKDHTYTTLEYARKEGQPLSLDLYRPQQRDAGKPVIVFIHGGGWKAGSNRQAPELNQYLSSLGYVVAAINYRLAPESIFPAQLEDIYSAINYLRRHAESLNIDPDRIVLIGRSAGAQLALMAAYSGHESAIHGVVSFYGPTDLNYSYDHPANPEVIDTRELLEDFLGGSPGEKPEAYIKASPVQIVSENVPPTLLIHGERDELVTIHHSKQLVTRLSDSGVSNYLLVLPWATHAFDFNLNGPGGQLSMYAVRYFLSVLPQK